MMGSLVAQVLGLPQSIRFLFVGTFVAGMSWLLRFPLSAVMPFTLAVFIATMAGMTVGFVLYQALVFRGSQRPLLEQLRDFVLVNLAASVVVIGVAAGSDQMLALAVSDPVGKAIAHALGIAAGAVLNFTGHRILTFGDARKPAVTDHLC